MQEQFTVKAKHQDTITPQHGMVLPVYINYEYVPFYLETKTIKNFHGSSSEKNESVILMDDDDQTEYEIGLSFDSLLALHQKSQMTPGVVDCRKEVNLTYSSATDPKKFPRNKTQTRKNKI